MNCPDLFRRQGALASLRPGNIQQLIGVQQQHQHDDGPPTDRPQLLQRLEALLAEGEKAAASLQQDSSSWGVEKLTLNTHRQVFEAILASMTTYRPLLLRVKRVYDAALEDALESAYDRCHLSAQLAAMTHRHADAVAAARQEAEAAAAAMNEELLHKLRELEQQAERVERECEAAEEQLGHHQRHVMAAHRELDQLQTSNRRAFKDLLEQSSWATAQVSS